MVSAADAEVGADLRALRKRRGITLEAVAAEMGWTHGYVSRIERGLRPLPAPEDLRRWVRYLGGEVRMLVMEHPTEAPDDPDSRALLDALYRALPGLSQQRKRALRGMIEAWATGE